MKTCLASLRTRIAAVACLLPPALALGQSPSANLEEIVVTGSRIARPDFESASPIVTLPAEAFARSNAASVETVVSRLPQFVPTFGSTSNNPGNGGQGNIQLRGMGVTSTLVLLDGRRLTPANGNGVVDVNVIPAALIESVEVITGGASAVYGSDAIAGVVNFKLKDEFQGLQVDAGWGQTERGDAAEYSASVTGGFEFAGGRGEAYGHLGYANRDAVLWGDRRYSRVALEYADEVGDFLPLGSPTILEGAMVLTPPQNRPSLAAWDALFESYGYAPGTIPLVGNNAAFNADRSLFATGNFTPGSVANFRGVQDPALANGRRYTYNFAPPNYLQLPLERYTAFGRASLEIADVHTAYAQLMYAVYTADTELAPTPAMQLLVPVGNPYIPPDLTLLLDSRVNPAADFSLVKRVNELGPRVASNDRDLLQGTLGIRGDLPADWKYEAYAQAGSYDLTETQSGNLLRSKVHELTYAADGGVAACGGFDLFGLDSISPRCAKYIAVDAANRDGYDQVVVEISVDGPAYSMPAGDLHVAGGVMYKSDEYFYRADPIATIFLEDNRPDIQGFNASKDIEGSDHNVDVYVEALVPVSAEGSTIGRLDVVLGYRLSDYDSAGSVDAYKAELLYTPVEPLRLRASYQHAVRAPSVFELYLPQLPVVYGDALDPDFGLVDPCSAGSPQRLGADAAAVEDLCLAQGVPPALLPDFADTDGEHLGVVGGNPDLEPETADTLTVGFVLQSWSDRAWLDGLRVSLDWYRIELEDAIVDTFAEDYVEWCFDPSVNPRLEAGQEFCNWFSRDPATGEMEVADLKRNLGTVKVSGIDAQLDWRFDLGPGAVGVNWLVSWMEQFEISDVGARPVVDDVGYIGGFIGGSLPEWKMNMNVGYDWGALATNLQWRYVDGMQARDAPTFEGVGSYDCFDFFASYVFEQGMLGGLTLRAGVENLTDEDPPLLANAVAANTDPSQYDALGRRYFLSASYRF